MRATESKFHFLLACLALLATLHVVSAAEIDPQKAKASSDPKTVWYDCKDLVVQGKGWTDTKSFYDRLPTKAEGKVTSSVWGLSHHSAGMCIPFTSDAPSIDVRWTLLAGGNLSMPHMPATGVSGVDLYSKDKSGRWCFVANGRPTAVTNTANFTPPTDQPCLLYLPLYNGVTSVEIGIPTGSRLAGADPAASKQRKPIVIYGTSITHGGCASRPGLAFPAIIGRQLETPVINLGFSGSGKMEPAMAELLAELDPAVYVLDCLWNMSPDLVSTRIEPFVKTLRAARPDTPILLAEDCSVRNVSPTEKGTILRKIHQKLTAEGVRHLHFLANEGMLGDDTEGTVDGCHPNDLGMMRQAQVFAKALSPLLPKGR
ncbi:MAG: SGNH/GDSL hydrolase family protein [Planctomycetota bacterium]|nr:SGNH/GDSL hydrolase family protein [Planctomycetota bacterium]